MNRHATPDEIMGPLLVRLNDKQKRYLEATRWLFGNDARGEGRTTLQAYVFFEEALRDQGTAVWIVDHYMVKASSAHLQQMIKQLAQTAGIADERVDTSQETFKIAPICCDHCFFRENDHINGQCPFASTSFRYGFIGRNKRPDNTWRPESNRNSKSP